MAGDKTYPAEDWTGEVEDKPTVMELIHKYIPTKTQMEWVSMCSSYEDTIHRHLMHIHQLHQQYEALAEKFERLYEETGKRNSLRLDLGRVVAEGEKFFPTMERHVRVTWSPKQYATCFAVMDGDIHMNPEAFPLSIAAAKDNFVKSLTEHLTREYEIVTSALASNYPR